MKAGSLLLIGAAAVTACAAATTTVVASAVYGEPQKLGDGAARVYAEIDADGLATSRAPPSSDRRW